MFKTKTRLLGALLVVSLGTVVLAHGGVKNPAVMARMEVMKAIGDAVKIIGKMDKGATAFDAETARAAAKQVALHAAKTSQLFEMQETDPKSEALPEIWVNFDDFSAKAKDLEAVATALSQSIRTPQELGIGLRQLGATCKACHGEYRK